MMRHIMGHYLTSPIGVCLKWMPWYMHERMVAGHSPENGC